MRIAYLVPEFPGQTHIFFWRELEALSKMDVEACLVSTRHPPKAIISHSWADDAQAKTLYLAEIGVREALRVLIQCVKIRPSAWSRALGGAMSGCPLKRVPRNLVLIFFAVRLVCFMRRANLKHIHSHSCGDAALLAMLANRLAGITYSLTLHGPLTDYGGQQKIKFRYASFAIAITRKLRSELYEQLLDDAPKVIGLAPMGVDPSVFQRASPYMPWQGNGPLRLFSCGRLNYVKGHQELIEAISIVRKSGVDARLEIAGEDDFGGGGYHKELDALIERLDLHDAVSLLGSVSEKRVLDELCAAHLFVLASHHEPLGVAIMEALSCGTPVVSTNLGGVTELIDHEKDGYLVAPKNAQILADAIQYLLRNPTLEMQFSDAGRTKVIKKFNSDLSAKELKKLILARTC